MAVYNELIRFIENVRSMPWRLYTVRRGLKHPVKERMWTVPF